MKNPKFGVITIVAFLVLCAIAVFIYWITQNPSNEQYGGGGVNTDPLDESYNTTSEPPIPPEQEAVSSRPLIDLDEGNEIYLDVDVVSRLTENDSEGEEDLANSILDAEILLVNHFVKAGYTHRAICQMQRFYYDFYDMLQLEPIENLIEKLSACFPPEGAESNRFSKSVQDIFGWGADFDFSYVLNVEVEK